MDDVGIVGMLAVYLIGAFAWLYYFLETSLCGIVFSLVVHRVGTVWLLNL